ncbi:MAG TPA: preprotein translocase subunit YajC [Nocardioidaceae bacterium]|nr:preprotein translocase subunit YajC [Nocardioidaceae bacterium]
MEALVNLLPLLLIAGLFWFLLIRPAQRRQREATATQHAATVGSEVMLTSGIFGIVTDSTDETLQLEVAPGTVLKVARGAVARVLSDEPVAAEEQDETSDAAESTAERDGQ